jgi:hypothetical protein
MSRTGFLFNHDHVHQIPHAAPVGFELSNLAKSMDVVLITTSKPQTEYLNLLETDHPRHRCKYTSISIPRGLSGICHFLDKVVPATRIAMLACNLEVFRNLDVLVVPEKTSLLLKTVFGLNNLLFVYTSHGAGDREIGFDKDIAGFDLIFLSGPKIRKRMQDAGLLMTAASCAIGYPKFDAFNVFTKKRARLFGNDRPVVLYNPHFSPTLSSWFKMGEQILDYFYNNDKFNLIFAPHVMLYKRKAHIAPASLAFGWTRKMARRYQDCPHILIDTGSIACTDMTYTLASDVYLGDVSSQIWEFLVKPRPCVFANTHKVAWDKDPNYLHWHTGLVFDDIQDLDSCLERAISTHGTYLAKQVELFKYTFDITEEPSSRRAANAILKFMNIVV